MSDSGAVARIVSLDNPVQLLLLAESSKPVTSLGPTFDRQLFDDHCALLVLGSRDQPTCLYLWTIPLRNLTSWLGHAGAWLRHYPRWRSLHGLPPADQSVRIVLAAPDFNGEIHAALDMLATPVTLVRYVCLEVGAMRSLCWEGEIHISGSKRASGMLEGVELSPEELSFFRRALPAS